MGDVSVAGGAHEVAAGHLGRDAAAAEAGEVGGLHHGLAGDALEVGATGEEDQGVEGLQNKGGEGGLAHDHHLAHTHGDPSPVVLGGQVVGAQAEVGHEGEAGEAGEVRGLQRGLGGGLLVGGGGDVGQGDHEAVLVGHHGAGDAVGRVAGEAEDEEPLHVLADGGHSLPERGVVAAGEGDEQHVLGVAQGVLGGAGEVIGGGAEVVAAVDRETIKT